MSQAEANCMTMRMTNNQQKLAPEELDAESAEEEEDEESEDVADDDEDDQESDRSSSSDAENDEDENISHKRELLKQLMSKEKSHR